MPNAFQKAVREQMRAVDQSGDTIAVPAVDDVTPSGASENNQFREQLLEAINLNGADKYGQFEHAASALSAAGKIAARSSAELRFLIQAGSAVATDFTSEFSTGAAIAAVKYTDGPGPDDNLVLTDQEKAEGIEVIVEDGVERVPVVVRPGASGYSAAVSDPLGAGPFDLAEDTDMSDGRSYYKARATFEMRIIDQRDYLVVLLVNDCEEFDFNISEFYFNGPDGLEFQEAVCVDISGHSEPWDYSPSVLN